MTILTSGSARKKQNKPVVSNDQSVPAAPPFCLRGTTSKSKGLAKVLNFAGAALRFRNKTKDEPAVRRASQSTAIARRALGAVQSNRGRLAHRGNRDDPGGPGGEHFCSAIPFTDIAKRATR